MKIIVDLPDWYIKQTKAIKHPDFVNEAIAKGKLLDDIDKEEIRAYFGGEAFGWDEGREALIEDLKAEFIKLYPKNYMGEPYFDGIAGHFSLNNVLKILDNIGKAVDKC